MKQKNRRMLSFLLALLLILPCMAACSEKNADTAQDPTPTTADPVEELSVGGEENADEIDFSSMSFIERTKYANAAVSDNLPEKTYDDKTLRSLPVPGSSYFMSACPCRSRRTRPADRGNPDGMDAVGYSQAS